MDTGEGGGASRTRRRPAARTRLSAEKRGRFLEVLGQTGNRRLAAEAIGVEARLMDQRREFDPLLDREWRAALEQAERRLAGASGPLDCIGGAEPMVIRRGRGGRLCMVRAGPKRWSRPVEEQFFAHLSATGNIAASARAVGFSQSAVDQRRRKFTEFAVRMEDALDDAEVEIEFRLAAEVRGRRVPGAEAADGADGADAADAVPRDGPFDLDAAMRFLKWREDKRRGRNRYGRRDGEARARAVEDMPIDAVREEVLRRVAAIRLHAKGRDGAAEGGD